MIKIKTVNILGQPKDILDLKIEYDKTPKNIPTVSEDCLEVHENCAYHLSNNLRLNEISLLIIFQFYCKISKKKQLGIAVEATYGLHSNQCFETLNLTIGGRSLVTRRFWLHSNLRGVDKINNLPISIDFRIQKYGVVTPVQCSISMPKRN